MIIDKDGFYDLSDVNSREIIIEGGFSVIIYDEGKYNKNIYLNDNSKVKFYGIFEKNNSNKKINVYEEGEFCFLEVNLLLTGNIVNTGLSNINVEILNNNGTAIVNILSIILDNGYVNVDGIIKVEKDLKNISCLLKEEIIYLGESGKVLASPKLFIKSDDVKASHSCKVYRFKDIDLFYMNSRGIPGKIGKKLLLESRIKILFDGLKNKSINNYLNYL